MVSRIHSPVRSYGRILRSLGHRRARRRYQTLLDKYHLRADECIFIDDRADNLVAASALGFGTYEMHGVGTLLRSLPTFGVSLH